MGVADVLVGWRDFYAVAAGASATLVGLVFVGVSIQVARQPLDARARLLGTMAVVNLLHPFWVSLAMLAPIPPAVMAAALLVLAVVGLPVIVAIDRAQGRLPRHEARVVVAYRFVVPLVAEVILAVGAVAMIAGGQSGVFAPAAFVVLMFVVGTENAWDLLLGTGLGPQDRHP